MISFLLHLLFAGRKQVTFRPKCQLRRVRPRLEALEDRWAPASLHVGSGPHEFASIQAAVNAAKAGDTVQVDPGTYAEQVTINKSITLQGDHNKTVIAPPTTPLTFPFAIVDVTGNRTCAEIQNITINGGASGTPGLLYGLRVDGNANAQIQNSSIINIIDSSDPSLGVAIDVGNSSASPDGTGAQIGTAQIQNDTISNYQRAGVVINHTGSSARVENNTISGGPASTADSVTGVEVSDGAVADIENNTITGNTNDSNGTGVLIFNPGVQRLPDFDNDPNDFFITQVNNNKLTGNDYGIFGSGVVSSLCFQPASASINNNQIRDNTFVGIEFDNSSNLFISNNQLFGNGSNNTADGGIYLFQSSYNWILDNQSKNNDGSGIYIDPGLTQSIGNVLLNNQMQGNSTTNGNADAVDLSTGFGTADTGNLWFHNRGKTFITVSGESLVNH